MMEPELMHNFTNEEVVRLLEYTHEPIIKELLRRIENDAEIQALEDEKDCLEQRVDQLLEHNNELNNELKKLKKLVASLKELLTEPDQVEN